MPRPSTHKPPDYDHLSIAPASMLLPLEPLLGLERADRQSYSDRDATATQTQTQTMVSSDASLAGGLALMICALTVPVAEWQNKAAVVCNLIAWHATWSSTAISTSTTRAATTTRTGSHIKRKKKTYALKRRLNH